MHHSEHFDTKDHADWSFRVCYRHWGVDLTGGHRLIKASVSLFDNPAIKWGAIITAVLSAIAGTIYLLASKNALKRKVTEYGEVSFVVLNGKPRRYRWGSRRGQLVVRKEGQGKNVIPKLRDQVTISWLPDLLEDKVLETMYGRRRLGYDLSIEYSLPEPKNQAAVEALADMVFGFRDRNRYNEESGTFEKHLINRVREAVPNILVGLPSDEEGLPIQNPDAVDWLQEVKLHDKVTLASLRVSLLNMRFTSQIDVR